MAVNYRGFITGIMRAKVELNPFYLIWLFSINNQNIN